METPAIFGVRTVLVTGKGGVGKSTTAAALAVAGAKRGRRTLLLEIGDDLAVSEAEYSPLARHFGRNRFGCAPESLRPGLSLFGAAISARRGQELFLASVLKSETLAHAAMKMDAVRKLADAAPSFKEMGVFFQILSWLKQERSPGVPEYEWLVCDLPATGHALALTALPEAILKLIPKGPIAAALREGQAHLNHPERAAAWVVTLPEQLPVSETFDLIEGLRKTHVPVGGVILNRFSESALLGESEREVLHRWIESRDLLGAEGVYQLEENREAVQRLRSALNVRLACVPELEANPTVVETMSDLFARGLS